MPKYLPNLRFSDCWGSAGNITFYHKNGECYYRTKANPTFPATPAQQVQVSIHQRGIRAWRSLDHNEQLEWNALATNVRSKRPPFINKTYISGYNLFMSAYHGFACIGDEKVPEPKKMDSFPIITLEYKSSFIEDGNMIISFDVKGETDELFKRYIPVAKLQLTKVGEGLNPGKMRNHIASSSGSLSEIYFTIYDYVGYSGYSLEEYQLYMRYFIIDNLTGYRSSFRNQYKITIDCNVFS